MKRTTRLLAATIVGVLLSGVLGARSLDERPDPTPTPRVVALSPDGPLLLPVVDELAARGVRLQAGRLLAVRSRRVLDADAFPPVVRLYGRPVGLTDEVPPGSPLLVEPGRDRVEPVVERRLELHADSQGGLYRQGRPGVVELRVGAVSGEVVGRRVLSTAARGGLRQPGTVLLTFDDGPDPVWTPMVLDVLRRAHVHAVFCLIGRDVRRHPDLVRRIVAEGHMLCDHTQGHDEQLASDPATVARAQITAGAASIEAVTGQRPLWFRAPGGSWSPFVERVAAAEGMASLKWTVDPRDWERPSASVIVHRVLAVARPGAVILLHDGGGDRSTTVNALRGLLRWLPRVGLHVAEPGTP